MDLGRARLRKIGLNNLHCAVHPHHGVIWTDGKGIYLAPIQVEGHQVQNAASVKVGEFENVSSVHWSSTTNTDSCHMCVVHQQNVTVWRVSGALPKLIFKQVRKINVRPVPQGCLWNPRSDILCLLSRHQCSFYFRHDTNKANYAFPALESSSISCGCWSPDGTKLIICVGAALLIYRWSNITAALENFSATAWRIPGLEGKLTAIAPVLKDSVVVAAEIPLESLCKQQDMFKVPDTHGDSQKTSDDVIRPNKASSVAESLLNLQPNAQVVTDTRPSLTLIHLLDGSHDPNKLSTVPLKGALIPDILMYERSSQCVIVGSNSQSQLHIYALLEKHLAYCGNIQLDKDQRPKGLCSMPTSFDDRGAALLILVGQREKVESGLIAPSTETDFRLSMKYIILKAGYNHARHNGRSDSVKDRSSDHSKSSSLIKSEKITHHMKNLSDSHIHKLSDYESQDEQKSLTKSPDDQSKIPVSATEESLLESGDLFIRPQDENAIHKPKLIDDLSSDASTHTENLEVDTISFSSQTPTFNNSKLTADYSLDPVCNSLLNDQTDSLHSSMSKDTETVGDVRKADTISRSPLSQEVKLLSAFKNVLKEHDNIESHSPQRQENSSVDTDSGICHSQNSPSCFYLTHDNDQFVKLPEKTPNLQLSENKSFSSSSQSEIDHEIIIPTQAKKEKRESQNHYPSSQSEIDHEIIIPTQAKREPQNHYPSSQSEIDHEIIIPTQAKREPQNHYPSSQSEIEHETIIPTQAKREPQNHYPSSQSEIDHEIIIPTQVKREPQNHYPSSQSEIDHEIIIPTQAKREPQNHYPSSQSEIEHETIIPTQAKREPQNHLPNSQSKIEPEIIIPSQTKKEQQNHFPSSQSEREPEIITPTQTKRESQKQYTSSQLETKSESTAILSPALTESASRFTGVQNEIKLDIEPIHSHSDVVSPSFSSTEQIENITQTSAILSQTLTDSMSHDSELQPNTKETKCQIISSTEIISPIQAPILHSETKPHTTPVSFEAEHKSADNFNTLQSGDNSKLSDVRHSLQGDHGAENNMLPDLGCMSSQHSTDSIWDALEKQAISQKESIDALHRRLEELSTVVEKTACVSPTKYQDITKPDVIEISCEKPEGTVTKSFLLDNGRLQLEPVKLAFGLCTVELYLNGVPCVLGANIDGYIPLKFTSLTKLHISGQG